MRSGSAGQRWRLCQGQRHQFCLMAQAYRVQRRLSAGQMRNPLRVGSLSATSATRRQITAMAASAVSSMKACAATVGSGAAELLPFRKAMYHAMTGEPIDGKTAADWGLVNESLPLAQLRDRVTEVARVLLDKNPVALKATKDAVRRVGTMTYDEAEDYLVRAQEAANSYDNEGRKEGIRQFIDEKSYKPGLGAYDKRRHG